MASSEATAHRLSSVQMHRLSMEESSTLGGPHAEAFTPLSDTFSSQPESKISDSQWQSPSSSYSSVDSRHDKFSPSSPPCLPDTTAEHTAASLQLSKNAETREHPRSPASPVGSAHPRPRPLSRTFPQSQADSLRPGPRGQAGTTAGRIRSLFSRGGSNLTGFDQVANGTKTFSSSPKLKLFATRGKGGPTSRSDDVLPVPPTTGSCPEPSFGSSVDPAEQASSSCAAAVDGLNGRDTLQGNGLTIRFDHARQRSSSDQYAARDLEGREAAPYALQHEWRSRPAVDGVGTKARRLSMTLPDAFVVDTFELDREYASASKIPLKRGKLVGTGATSTVRQMVRKGHGDVVFAVKEFRKRGRTEDAGEYDKKVKSEYTIARSLSHQNIVETIALCTHNGRWNVVMEYCSGELWSLAKHGHLKQDDKLCLWKQLLRGVSHLHAHGIAHRDIKLENLLIDSGGQLKVTDFGVSTVFRGEHPGLVGAAARGGAGGRSTREIRRCKPGVLGSLPYIAPEVLAKKSEYDPRPLDVWSSAIVFLALQYGGTPWPEAIVRSGNTYYNKFHDAYQSFLDTKPCSLPSEAHSPTGCGPVFANLSRNALRLLLLKMLHPDPDVRIPIRDALSDRWVRTIVCCGDHASGPVDGRPSREPIDATKLECCDLLKFPVKWKHDHFPLKAPRLQL